MLAGNDNIHNLDANNPRDHDHHQCECDKLLHQSSHIYINTGKSFDSGHSGNWPAFV
ncbi:hypothetical protein M407DRAFT_243865 [Tulasnella calospora MUT 4182]|uniref:Uncharacterized protein n=1 Tax=Tulasnella calospora MUT 4182 TaxID=1051891 RepID=A0A0C3QJ14_9AGAM|nr:hypothetical protein M407DRAFT_243865 [Tulasnella calospora MUT 4182]